MENNNLIPHLFRTEYSKIIAVLCKTFGVTNIQMAEDVVGDTFLKATEVWGLKGVPENPKAWLYVVAKNKIKDKFKRDQLFVQKIAPELKSKIQNTEDFEIDLSDENIRDSQLRMLFSVCSPIISKEAQITLALRILCGFGIDEISTALLTKKATIKKRLSRAKVTLRDNNFNIDISDPEIEKRLDVVLSVLYLLFNEGYYSTTSSATLRKDLCIEAMRLAHLLLNYTPTNVSQTNALMALFCFHSSRFEARIDQFGDPVLYDDQDRKKWNFELIQKGNHYLAKASRENTFGKYLLEALIAYWHTRTDVNEKEKWESVLQLYNQLIQIEYSPVTALNRTYALAMAENKEIALKEALKINLSENHLYHSLLAELYSNEASEKRLKHLQIALRLAENENDKRIIRSKIKAVK